MIGKCIVKGAALVSREGLIADRNGAYEALQTDDVFQHFLEFLDNTDLCVMGRKTYEHHANKKQRKRYVLTHQFENTATSIVQENAYTWKGNVDALVALIEAGEPFPGASYVPKNIAILGGTEPYDIFAPYYDEFVLTQSSFTLGPVDEGIPFCSLSGDPESIIKDYYGLGHQECIADYDVNKIFRFVPG